MRSDQAFKVANKVAAPLTVAGGVVLALGGVLAALLGKSSAGPVLIACALACAGPVRRGRDQRCPGHPDAVTHRLI